MKTLWLLRHAKANRGEGLADRDRPLAGRGRDAAERVGRHLAARGARFDLVLCSPSRRTRETLELVAKALDREPVALDFDEALYLASARDLRACVAQTPHDVSSLLLVGHNPGMAELALALAVRGDRSAREALRRKFPTGALAEFRVSAPSWSRFERGCELASFVIPKLLRP